MYLDVEEALQQILTKSVLILLVVIEMAWNLFLRA